MTKWREAVRLSEISCAGCRMPRASQPVFEYQHAGRSVLMGEDLEEVRLHTAAHVSTSSR